MNLRAKTVGVAVAGAMAFAVSPSNAIAAPTASQPVTVSASSTQADAAFGATVRKNIRIAKALTDVDAATQHVTFDKRAAIKRGMTRDFAEAYAGAIQEGQSLAAARSPRGVIGCIVAATGWTLAFAALAAATFATGGALALALAGYTVSSIGLVLSCY